MWVNNSVRYLIERVYEIETDCDRKSKREREREIERKRIILFVLLTSLFH